MNVHAIPCLKDNYAYVVANGRLAFVIDPSEAEPVEAALAAAALELVAIVNTHHHWDHTGGNEALLAAHPGVPVIAHESDRGRVPGQTTGVGHEERFCIAGLDIVALHVPGHTLGALTYLCDGAAFTGDTLFIGGCGRLFEGTPAMMHESLCRKLARLDHATIVYCGHEYTVQNLRFAQTIEPENPHVREKLAAAQAARARGERTVSTIGDELRTNPFMRVGEAALARFGADPVSVLAAVRRAKDNFSG